MADRRPALVVRPSPGRRRRRLGASIRSAGGARHARRCGGHSIPGLSTCDDGIVIHLSRMRSVEVDPQRRVARISGGSLLGDLDDAAQKHDLVCLVGVVSHTGVAGLTLGGGMGRLQRKHGLTIDNLLAGRARHGGRPSRAHFGGRAPWTCSGASVERAPTSASRPRSSSGSTRCSTTRSPSGRSSTRWSVPPSSQPGGASWRRTGRTSSSSPSVPPTRRRRTSRHCTRGRPSGPSATWPSSRRSGRRRRARSRPCRTSRRSTSPTRHRSGATAST